MRLACASPATVAALVFPFLLLSGPARPSQDAAQIEAWLRQGEQALQTRQLEEARGLFERARAAASALGLEALEAHAYCGAGDVQYQLARYADAQQLLERCLEKAERMNYQPGIGSAAGSLSATFEQVGKIAEARAFAERAAAAYERAGDRRGRARATLQIMRTSERTAEDRSRLYERAIEDAQSVGDAILEGSALHSWGDRLHAYGRYEESFEKLQAAERVYQSAGAIVPLGTVYNSLGRLYRAHGRLDEALKSQLKALELHRSSNAPFELLQSTNAVGAVYAYLDDPRAMEYYEKALALAEKTSSPRIQDFVRANIANELIERGEFARAATILEGVIERKLDAYPSMRHNRLANARLGLGDHEGALRAVSESMAICRKGTLECINAQWMRAAVHIAAGRHSDALADIRGAFATIEEVRAKLVPSDFFRQNFHRSYEDAYSQAIALQVYQQQPLGALESAELARARAFLDLLASRDVQVPAVPAAGPDVVASARRLNSTFLLYWVAEDATYAWVVSPNGRATVRKIDVRRARLARLVRETAPGELRWKADQRPWQDLHNLLVAPIKAALPSQPGAMLTIVPHGPLLNLSFAALKNPSGRYLLEDYTLHYVPAAAVLAFTQQQSRQSPRSGQVLIVSDPQVPVRSKLDAPLPRLPGARTEARAIASITSAARRTLLEDTEATESRVRDATAQKAVLHFATHAVLRDDDPFASFLALGSARNTPDDGRLTATEIYRLKLDADLVVLSACRSGSGVVTGDGIATFARAFLYAGAPSLVVSLWDVADEPSNRLVPSFYRGWLAGATKASALRSAQLALLRDLRANKVEVQTAAGPVHIPEHPVFWAGFALIGEPK